MLGMDNIIKQIKKIFLLKKLFLLIFWKKNERKRKKDLDKKVGRKFINIT